MNVFGDISTAPLSSNFGSHSGRRLGNALLAYFIGMTLLVTWAPFRFATAPQHGFTTVWSWSDLLLNVVMFLPLGFFWQSARAAATASPWWTAVLMGLCLSGVIEVGQLFLMERFSSPFDLVTNTLGAAVGAGVFRQLRPRVSLGAATVTSLSLEVPLMGLVVLLIPLFWVATAGGGASDRMWLLLLLAGFGGAVIGAVHGARPPEAVRLRPAAVPLAAAAWFLVATVPGLAPRPNLLVAGSMVAMGAALLLTYSTAHERRTRGEQRMELRMLRLVLPLFAAYLTLSSLWPIDAMDGIWRVGWELAPARSELSRRLLLRALEYLASFTLVGYVTAELFGRDNRSYRRAVCRVAISATGLTLLLEFARGWNTMIGGSGVLALLATGSALFGGWLYHLQRDHIRTLLARPGRPLGIAMDG